MKDIITSRREVDPDLFIGVDVTLPTDDTRTQTHIGRDIDFILNEKRAEQLDPYLFSKFVSSSSEINKSNFSDEQLMRFCKSRYIQEPADMDKYLTMLKNQITRLSQHAHEYEDSLEELNAYEKELKEQKDKTETSTEE